MLEAGLAYEQDLPINYCPSCKTGLANEEVLANGTCDRCGTLVIKKKIRQWVLAITKYADRLARDVEDLDWPEGIKEMQKTWIGRSEGCEFNMKKSDDENISISVYTTRIDTVFGMTYVVIAPDYKDVEKFISPSEEKACKKYTEDTRNKSDLDRTETNKDKT
jgi:leucyl-tRNA synthetase